MCRMASTEGIAACYREELLDHASAEDLACMLHKCRKEHARGLTFWLHTHIIKRGLETCASLANYLVLAYVEMNCLEDAQLIFDRFAHLMNESSCGYVISAHAKSGSLTLALSVYHRMNRLGSVNLHSRTYINLLKACSKLKDLSSGARIHADIAKKGLSGGRDMFVGSALVDMYANCGCFDKARKVLDAIPTPNVFAWNALATGYIRNGRFQKVLECISQMQLAGVALDTVTHVCILKACGAMGAIDKVEELYDEICKRGQLGENIILGSTLVDMFARCGCLAKARQVFDELPVRDVIMWTALITGYVQHAHAEQALLCYEQMQLEGVCPDPVTVLCSLKACGNIRDIDKGCEIHHELEVKGLLGGDIVLGSSLVDMYSKCGSMLRARQMFDRFASRNVVLWNALIAGYADYGHGEEALKCFEQMKLEGILPDHVSYSCALKACCCTGAVQKGSEIHADIARKDLSEDEIVVASTLIDLYAKCGSVVKAQQVFDKMVVRDVISWTSLIAGYGEHGHSEKALLCFEKMQAEGISPNALTFVYSLKACGEIGATARYQNMHVEIERKGLLDSNVLIGSTLIDMYAKRGLITKAQQVFDKLPIRDVISWTPLITGYAQVGECKHVFQVFERMIGDGIKPDSITFVTVLNACSRACLWYESENYFETMKRDYGIAPSLEHHSCMIDLLGRTGQFSKAMEILKKMQDIPNLAIWRTVLGACENWGNRKLGKHAFENSLHMNDEDASAYIFMSRLHADSSV